MIKQALRWPAAVGLTAAGLIAVSLGLPAARAQDVVGAHDDGQFGSLTFFPPPMPDLTGVVTDPNWAIVLGKALFWDTRAGSDGQACASCHFHAGADPRIANGLSPGLNSSPQDTTFQPTASGGAGGPNYTRTGKDFPFHQLADVTDRESAVLFDTNDISGSAGSFSGGFVSVSNAVIHTENCSLTAPDDIFHIAGTGPNAGKTLSMRRVEPRNTPSVINAVYNIRNFWDGRANNVFNGVDPFGFRNPDASIVVSDGFGGLFLEPFAIPNASLASQSVGPILSTFEMSCLNRSFADIGKKLEKLIPLQDQVIDANDSVFGRPGPFGDLRGVNLMTGVGKGLNTRFYYQALIKRAFDPRYWMDNRHWRISNGQFVRDDSGYTQLELNFSMFWGISIMLYEATLVSDDTPFDHFMDNGAVGPVPGFGDAEIRGLEVFANEGGCIHCHDGPLFTRAAPGVNRITEDNMVERMQMADGGVALYDNGFYNIGVRPTREDPGVGGTDPFGNPLSFTRQYVANPFFPEPDFFQVDPCQFADPFDNCTFLPDDFSPLTQRIAVDGSFKVPTLRNVALNPPYFHNGGQGTLAQVVQFYSRGGDSRKVAGGDTTGSGLLGEDPLTAPPSGSNLHPEIFRRDLTAQQQSDLVAFLKSLTDDRVRCHKAPFDHPELTVSHGADPAGTPNGVKAAEVTLTIAATGKDGLAPAKCALIANDGDVDELPDTLRALEK